MSQSFLDKVLIDKTQQSLLSFYQQYKQIKYFKNLNQGSWEKFSLEVPDSVSQKSDKSSNQLDLIEKTLNVLIHDPKQALSQADIQQWPCMQTNSHTFITGLLLRYDQRSEDYWSLLSEFLLKLGLKHLVVEHEPFRISYACKKNFLEDKQYFEFFKPSLEFEEQMLVELTFIKVYAQGYESKENIGIKIKS